MLIVALSACGSALPQQHVSPNMASLASRAAVSCRGRAPGAADPSAIHGLMVWIDSTQETTKDPSILQYLSTDPNVCGASIIFLWSGIDKGPAAPQQYKWSIIENTIGPWVAAGKFANLLFIGVNEVGTADTATPPWVLAQTGPNAVDTVPCPNPGKGNAGPPTPVYWEPGYGNPWRAFIKAVVAQYGKDPRIGYMRFGLGAGAEDFPQHGADANCFKTWNSKYGLTAKSWAKFSAGLTRYIGRTSHASGATVQQIVALNPFSDPQAPYPVADHVANAASAVGVGFGTENLGSGNYGYVVQSCTKDDGVPYWCAAYDAHAGQVPEEFQPINFTLQKGTHIAPLPTLLRYAMYNHAQIFELYPQEWLTADDGSYPTYPAHHVAWQRALTRAAAILGTSPIPVNVR
jgi:hypothetical protein